VRLALALLLGAGMMGAALWLMDWQEGWFPDKHRQVVLLQPQVTADHQARSGLGRNQFLFYFVNTVDLTVLWIDRGP
jgi:hypothetical protein